MREFVRLTCEQRIREKAESKAKKRMLSTLKKGEIPVTTKVSEREAGEARVKVGLSDAEFDELAERLGAYIRENPEAVTRALDRNPKARAAILDAMREALEGVKL